MIVIVFCLIFFVYGQVNHTPIPLKVTKVTMPQIIRAAHDGSLFS